MVDKTTEKRRSKMYNSLAESEAISAALQSDVDKFLEHGGKIQVIDKGYSTDLLNITFADSMRKVTKDSYQRVKKANDDKATKKHLRARYAYELRQAMPTEKVMEIMDISRSSYSRLIQYWRDHCQVKRIEFKMPTFYCDNRLQEKHDREEKVAGLITDGHSYVSVGEVLGVTKERVGQIYRNYLRRKEGS